jgi:radical SAM protein with 4Fe4S-binding SPASM domain
MWSIWKSDPFFRPQYMTVELATLIAKELNDWIPHGRRIEMALQGEPLMNKNINQILSTFRLNYPRCQLLIATNGDLLQKDKDVDSEKILNLLNSGLNFLLIDVYDEGMYDWWLNALTQKGLPVKEFYKGFKVYHYVSWKEKQVVLMDSISSRSGEDQTRVLNNQAGNVLPEFVDKLGIQKITRPLPHACSNPFRELVIRYDGTVPICCMDVRKQFVIGKFPEQTLKSIWNGKAYESARKYLYAKKREFGPCDVCNYKGFKLGLLHDPEISFEEAKEEITKR